MEDDINIDMKSYRDIDACHRNPRGNQIFKRQK